MNEVEIEFCLTCLCQSEDTRARFTVGHLIKRSHQNDKSGTAAKLRGTARAHADRVCDLIHRRLFFGELFDA
jgi:hypothetical protein